MTPQAIRDGFDSLRTQQQMQGLADAARSRSEADWLVGINGTRALTAFNSREGGFFLTTVGRVQTPTLSVVVEREEQIRKFVSRDFWEIHAEFAAAAGTYPAKWFNPQHKKDGEDKEKKEDRVWSLQEAQAVADAVRGKNATVTEESKPRNESSKALFDLTTLQKEANSRFGFSAKTTLALAQSLYERHKALTYPRTDSQHLPEDYLQTVKDTMEMLAKSPMKHLAPFAKTAIDQGYIKPSPKVFNNAKVSDHFAIIPTLQAPSGLSEAEQKLYDFVVRRFMAVFYPPAKYMDTTRVSQVGEHHFKSSGKVLVEPGWQAIYGKEVDEEEDKESGKVLVKVQPGETPKAETTEPKGLKTKPPARYTEATLLTAMQTAGKNVEDDDQREAMQDKGLGTPATRAAIIEGLLVEKYIVREIRELVPTAKAFQLFTLLRGLGVEELSKPELTGGWEHKLAMMEHGELSREAFMREIAEMTEHIVKKAKEYDRDTIPGDYTTLKIACPTCGGVVKENYRRYGCIGKDASAADGAAGCGFSISKIPGGRTFEAAEVEQLIADKKIGPLEGFRSKAGWPFTAEIALKFSDEEKNWKLEFDFGEDKNTESGEIVEFADTTSLGNCPKCSSPVYDHGSNYVCSKSVPTHAQPTPSCDFKSGKIILQQAIASDQMAKLLAEGKTDLLDKFVSLRTRRPFKAFLQWDAEAGKVNFAFEPRASKYPARAGKTPTTNALIKAAGKKVPAKTTKAAKAKAEKVAKPKAPRKVTAGFLPSNELAAVIGADAVARTEVIKKIWDYIKANGLQDAVNKRAINADAKLKPVFGKDQITMFELAGIAGKHLRPAGD